MVDKTDNPPRPRLSLSQTAELDNSVLLAALGRVLPSEARQQTGVAAFQSSI
jgi:FXSXX-COOH protein